MADQLPTNNTALDANHPPDKASTVTAHRWLLLGVLAALAVAHAVTARGSEPFFNNDEVRHTMTGVFVLDALRDFPASASDPKGYAVRYYLQYPALGLLTWPPFFYGVEGLAMLVFGPTFAVGRWCVAAFSLVGLLYAYRFARLMLPPGPAVFAMGLVGLSPFYLIYSQRVMLEIPTFALAMASIVHFEKYLNKPQGRQAVLACQFAALALLTRFDAVFLLPYFGLRLTALRQWAVLLNRPVLIGVVLAVVLVGPYYLLTLKEYGAGLGATAGAGTQPESLAMSLVEKLYFYPTSLVYLLGWPQALAGFVTVSLVVWRRSFAVGAMVALLIAVYGTFTPMAEHETRHSLYWAPAWAIALAWATNAAWRFRRWLGGLLVFALVGGTIIELARHTFRSVRGYEDAVRWVLNHRQTERPILADGELSGSIVFHARVLDPARRLTVLRGDKLLYAMFSDPTSAYSQFAHTPAEVLAILHEYDPEFVIVEDPPPVFRESGVAGAELLARTLRESHNDFCAEQVIPIRTNYDCYEGSGLIVYRKLHRNPNAKSVRSLPVPGLGKAVGH